MPTFELEASLPLTITTEVEADNRKAAGALFAAMTKPELPWQVDGWDIDMDADMELVGITDVDAEQDEGLIEDEGEE